MTRILVLIALILFCKASNAQNSVMKLTLPEVIDLASRQSIDAFKQQNMYRSSFWAYKYYRADKLPSLSIGADPFSYSNSNAKVFDTQEKAWNYFQQESVNSDASLRLSQNVGLTGGSISVSSDLGMTKNFGDVDRTDFNADPFRIGYRQRLNGYNTLRWRSKIEPLKFEIAKRNFIQSKEDIAVKGTSKFFELVDAQIEINIATTNLANSDTLYQIAKGRYQVGTVTQDELLNFELNLMNSRLALTRANQGLLRARADLNSFLGLDKNSVIECILPSSLTSSLQVNVEEAIQKSVQNNPDVLSQEQRLLEQDNIVRQTRAQNGLSADVSASIGLTKKSTDLADAYQDPKQFRNLALVGLSIPILDWGRRKGQVLMAKSSREVVVNTVKQERIDFEQSVLMSVMEFNLQSNQVLNSARADTIAQMGFDVTMRRFKIGKLDVTKLNLARNDLENARRAYINSLRKYWTSYYQIRQVTLFDFEKGTDLTADFDKIVNQ